MVTLDVSLLVKVTVTGCPAGVGNVTANGTDWPVPTVTPEGRPIVPAA